MRAATAIGKHQQKISPKGSRAKCEEWLHLRKVRLMQQKGSTWAIHYFPAAVVSESEAKKLKDQEIPERTDDSDSATDE